MKREVSSLTMTGGEKGGEKGKILSLRKERGEGSNPFVGSGE